MPLTNYETRAVTKLDSRDLATVTQALRFFNETRARYIAKNWTGPDDSIDPCRSVVEFHGAPQTVLEHEEVNELIDLLSVADTCTLVSADAPHDDSTNPGSGITMHEFVLGTAGPDAVDLGLHGLGASYLSGGMQVPVV